jgi:hypothetical protein
MKLSQLFSLEILHEKEVGLAGSSQLVSAIARDMKLAITSIWFYFAVLLVEAEMYEHVWLRWRDWFFNG